MIYKISNITAYFLQYVIRYRTDLIKNNLKIAFPNKTDNEREKILKASFLNLSDIILETLKGMSMSYREIQKRYTFLNTEILESYYNNDQSVIGTAGHLANWEWATRCIGMRMDHNILGITKKINNPYIHKYIQKKRSEENVSVVDIPHTHTAFNTNAKKKTLFILIADQSPNNVNKSIWIDFLNQKTPFLHGPEIYATKYNLPIVFMPIIRIARGQYQVHIELLTNEPNALEYGKLTAIYAKRLEECIIKNPEQWLWSHNRWKRAHLYPES